jgi:hypothetical protein
MLVKRRKRKAGNKRCTPSKPLASGLLKGSPTATKTSSHKPVSSSHKPDSSSETEHPPATPASTTPSADKETLPPAPSPAPTPSDGLPSYMNGQQSGDGTYYSTGLGSCGLTNQDSDYIAAVSHLLFDTYP